MQESSVEVRGRKLRLWESGSGAPLVFLHGAGGAGWTPLLERLSADWHVMAPEHPGFGRSEVPDWMMSVGDLAFFYLDFLQELGLSQVHLVGFSLGGWLGAEIAIRNSSRLQTLTLMAPAGVSAGVPFGDIFLWSPEEAARRTFFNQDLAEERIRALAEADLDVTLQNRTATARLAWSPRLHSPQLPFWLHRIELPTLLVWGRDDQVVPFACHEPYQRGIPGAQLFALSETGHALPQERPEEIAQRLTNFFAEARP